MATFNIGNQMTNYMANEANGIYTLKTGNIMDVSGTAIYANAAVGGREFHIDGIIYAGDHGMQLGTDGMDGGASLFEVGATGFVNAHGSAVLAFGDNHHFSNAGSILGATGLALFGDGNSVNNSGHLIAQSEGIVVRGESATIVNSGLISGGTAVNILSDAGEKSTVTNTGTITGSQYSLSGQNGDETFINSGTLNGDVSMWQGNDLFEQKAGRVNGTVYGGDNNDTYILANKSLKLFEYANQGTDHVKSAMSFTLGDNFENLTLTGTGNINGYGNGLNNKINGNAGINKLSGGAGTDQLSGGAGNDTLTGGADADTFVFKAHGGKDIVTDFENGVDHFDLRTLSTITDFADLKAHHLTVSGADLVITAGDTIFTIKDTAKAELDATDFLI